MNPYIHKAIMKAKEAMSNEVHLKVQQEKKRLSTIRLWSKRLWSKRLWSKDKLIPSKSLPLFPCLCLHARPSRVEVLKQFLIHFQWVPPQMLTNCTKFDRESELTYQPSLHKKLIFPLKIYSVNVTKSAVSCGFGQIYWKMENFIFCAVLVKSKSEYVSWRQSWIIDRIYTNYNKKERRYIGIEKLKKYI